VDIVRASEQPTHSPARSNFRDGGIHFTPLHRGTVGDPGFFTMAHVRFDRYFTPRHRHNYEQIRVGIKGASPIGRNLDIPEGWVAYHPEGTPYGPQDITTTVEESPVVLAWQFGGPSMEGFFPASEFRPAYERLAERGRFEQGVYVTTGEDGVERRQDGYEAAWAEHAGRPMRYPPARFHAPVLMDPSAFHWVGAGEPGVAVKVLGAFGECGLRIWMMRIDAGSTGTLDPWTATRCGYVWRGAITVGAERYEAHSALRWEPNETGALVACEDGSAEVLLVDLHDLTRRAEAVR
jgi:hypothetical protein